MLSYYFSKKIFFIQDEDYEPSTFSTNKRNYTAPAALLNDVAQVSCIYLYLH